MSQSKEMVYRRLGRSGLTVSRLVLGTMNFGARTEEADARRIIDAAFDAGVNLIDTADTYAEGRSEEITGRAIAARRNDWVLATKLCNPNGTGRNRRGLSRKWIVEEAHASLKRLDTDFIDILYLHKEDHQTPVEETVRAIADLQRAGKIRYFGISNFKAWRIAQICAACDKEGIDRPIVDQPLYHAFNRSIETEILPACSNFGVGVLVYSPTARGVLTGKYRPDQAPPSDSRAALQNARMMQTEFTQAGIQGAELFRKHAEARGTQSTPFAIAWVLANPIVTGAIAGPRTMEQWESYVEALDVKLTAEDENFVDSLVPKGGTIVPNFIDPVYPVEGRPI